MDIQKLFEELYVKNARSWLLERDPDGSYKYHATQSAFVLFENQQMEIESLKSELAKAQAVPEGFVLMPKKPDVDKAWSIALKRIVPPPKTNDAIQKELMYKKYVDDLYSEQDRILLDYEAMIEAQEQGQ